MLIDRHLFSLQDNEASSTEIDDDDRLLMSLLPVRAQGIFTRDKSLRAKGEAVQLQLFHALEAERLRLAETPGEGGADIVGAKAHWHVELALRRWKVCHGQEKLQCSPQEVTAAWTPAQGGHLQGSG